MPFVFFQPLEKTLYVFFYRKQIDSLFFQISLVSNEAYLPPPIFHTYERIRVYIKKKANQIVRRDIIYKNLSLFQFHFELRDQFHVLELFLMQQKLFVRQFF